MATQNILPTLQADEKSAQLRLHPVPIQNGLIDAGRMLTDAGQGLQKASFGLMLGLRKQKNELQEQEDALALAEAKNGFMNDVTKQTAPLYNLTGKEAAGITEKAQNISITARDRHMANLSPRNARLFSAWVDQQSLSVWQRVQNHENTNVQKARVSAGQQMIENDHQTFVLTGDFHALAMMVDDSEEQYVNLYGAATDQIALDNFVQANIDKAYGQRLDYLFKNGFIQEGLDFFNSLNKDGEGGMPYASQEAYSVMQEVANRQQTVLDVDIQSELDVTDTVAQGGPYSNGGMYDTPDQDFAEAKMRDSIMNSNEPEWIKKVHLEQFDRKMKAKKTIQHAKKGADLASVIGDLGMSDDFDTVMNNYEVLGQRIERMPEGEVRAEAVKYRQSIWRSLQSELNARKAEAEKAEKLASQMRTESNRQYNEIKNDKTRQGRAELLKMYAGKNNPIIKYGNYSYDLRNADQRYAFLNSASWRYGGPLVEEDIQYIRDLYDGKIRPEYRDTAANAIAAILNRGKNKNWTGPRVGALAPELVDDVMDRLLYIAPDGKFTGKEMTDALNNYIITRLGEQRGTDPWGLFNSTITTMEKWLGKGLDKNGNIDMNFNLKAYYRLDQTEEDELAIGKAMLLNDGRYTADEIDNLSASVQERRSRAQAAKDAAKRRRERRKEDDSLERTASNYARRGVSEDDMINELRNGSTVNGPIRMRSPMQLNEKQEKTLREYHKQYKAAYENERALARESQHKEYLVSEIKFNELRGRTENERKLEDAERQRRLEEASRREEETRRSVYPVVEKAIQDGLSLDDLLAKTYSMRQGMSDRDFAAFRALVSDLYYELKTNGKGE